MELTNSLKNGYIVQLGSPAHLRCHVNLDTGSYQTWNRDLLRLKCIELGIRQDCLKLRRIVFNRWETDMNDVMKSLNITIHNFKWHDMFKSRRYPMGITHPPLSLGEMSRRIQVSAAESEKASEQEDILEHTTKSWMLSKIPVLCLWEISTLIPVTSLAITDSVTEYLQLILIWIWSHNLNQYYWLVTKSPL